MSTEFAECQLDERTPIIARDEQAGIRALYIVTRAGIPPAACTRSGKGEEKGGEGLLDHNKYRRQGPALRPAPSAPRASTLSSRSLVSSARDRECYQIGIV